MRAVLTLSLALTLAPLIINSSAKSLRLLKAASCNGVLPSYKPWMRFLKSRNNHNIISISYMKARIATIE